MTALAPQGEQAAVVRQEKKSGSLAEGAEVAGDPFPDRAGQTAQGERQRYPPSARPGGALGAAERVGVCCSLASGHRV